MSRINVRCEVREYPDKGGPYSTLIVKNHWNYRERVVFEIDGKSYVFLERDLLMAIKNAVNAHAF